MLTCIATSYLLYHQLLSWLPMGNRLDSQPLVVWASWRLKWPSSTVISSISLYKYYTLSYNHAISRLIWSMLQGLNYSHSVSICVGFLVGRKMAWAGFGGDRRGSILRVRFSLKILCLVLEGEVVFEGDSSMIRALRLSFLHNLLKILWFRGHLTKRLLFYSYNFRSSFLRFRIRSRRILLLSQEIKR